MVQTTSSVLHRELYRFLTLTKKDSFGMLRNACTYAASDMAVGVTSTRHAQMDMPTCVDAGGTGSDSGDNDLTEVQITAGCRLTRDARSELTPIAHASQVVSLVHRCIYSNYRIL